MAECNISDATSQIKAGLGQIQNGMKEMETELEAAMCAYHIAEDKERGRRHLTVGYRRIHSKVEQGLFLARRNIDKIIKKAQLMEREKSRQKEEEELLEALEEVESPAKKSRLEEKREIDERSTSTASVANAEINEETVKKG